MAKDTTAATKVKPAKPAKSAKADKPNIFARLGQYFRDVLAEMRRVVWPTRNEVINSWFVVVVTLLFFVAFTFVVDNIVIYLLALIQGIG